MLGPAIDGTEYLLRQRHIRATGTFRRSVTRVLYCRQAGPEGVSVAVIGERYGPILVITIDRPDVKNAVDLETATALAPG